MKTILISGGTDGMGRALAMHYLEHGDAMVIAGRSPEKGKRFLADAADMGTGERATFIQADLSLMSENRRLVEEVKASHDSLDALVLAVSLKLSKTERVTKEGLEFVFALMCLSRFTLGYGLADLLEKSPAPTILNIAPSGRKGEVDWDAIERSGKGLGGSPQFQSSRLNDLLGVSFSERERRSKGAIRYVLFNPWAMRSKGALNSYDSPVMKLVTRIIYAFIGQSVDEAIVPMVKLIDNPPADTLSAFIKTKPVDISMATFDPAKARRLDEATRRLLRETDGL